MTRKFDSRMFYRDEFFMDSIRFNDTQFYGFIKDGFSPRDEGLLAKFPGHWSLIVVNKNDMPDRPVIQSNIFCQGQNWRIITIWDSGDCWKFNAVSEQRSNR